MKLLNRGNSRTVLPAQNSGRTWTIEHEILLIKCFVMVGENATELALRVGRGRDSVITRLRNMSLLGEMWGHQYDSNYRLLDPERLAAKANKALQERGSDLVICEVHFNSCDTDGYRGNTPVISNNNPSKTEIKEQDMSAPIIETKTFIAGVDASTLTDAQIFDKIAQLESAAEKWSKVQNKPKKLGIMIDGIHADIKKLVEYVDGRS